MNDNNIAAGGGGWLKGWGVKGIMLSILGKRQYRQLVEGRLVGWGVKGIMVCVLGCVKMRQVEVKANGCK